MTESTLLWLALAGLAGWNLRMQWWIVGHSRCHTAPAERLASLEARVTGCEDDLGRSGKNIHKMRTIYQRIVLTLAAKGIYVKLSDGE